VLSLGRLVDALRFDFDSGSGSKTTLSNDSQVRVQKVKNYVSYSEVSVSNECLRALPAAGVFDDDYFAPVPPPAQLQQIDGQVFVHIVCPGPPPTQPQQINGQVFVQTVCSGPPPTQPLQNPVPVPSVPVPDEVFEEPVTDDDVVVEVIYGDNEELEQKALFTKTQCTHLPKDLLRFTCFISKARKRTVRKLASNGRFRASDLGEVVHFDYANAGTDYLAAPCTQTRKAEKVTTCLKHFASSSQTKALFSDDAAEFLCASKDLHEKRHTETKYKPESRSLNERAELCNLFLAKCLLCQSGSLLCFTDCALAASTHFQNITCHHGKASSWQLKFGAEFAGQCWPYGVRCTQPRVPIQGGQEIGADSSPFEDPGPHFEPFSTIVNETLYESVIRARLNELWWPPKRDALRTHTHWHADVWRKFSQADRLLEIVFCSPFVAENPLLLKDQ
jgi:hypothetical protein